jgi:cytochrome c-type biogenesis protein CcmH
MKRIILAVLLGVSAMTQAVEVRSFDDPEKQARFDRLVQDLRCLVCQNQSLADSDADLAKDLRDEVYGIIQSGQSEEEAIRFLTDRYGDFVLYRPPLKPITWLLWGGPLLILLAGVVFLVQKNRRRAAIPETGLSSDERKRLETLKKALHDKGSALR